MVVMNQIRTSALSKPIAYKKQSVIFHAKLWHFQWKVCAKYKDHDEFFGSDQC